MEWFGELTVEVDRGLAPGLDVGLLDSGEELSLDALVSNPATLLTAGFRDAKDVRCGPSSPWPQPWERRQPPQEKPRASRC